MNSISWNSNPSNDSVTRNGGTGSKFPFHRSTSAGRRFHLNGPLSLAVLSGVLLLPLISAARDATGPVRPNVVLIISDDMGYADMPGFGDDMRIPMPQMERLARGGVTFTDAYVSAPICVASRMGIFTGRHQARWGTYTNVYDTPAYEQFQCEKTIARYFKDAGYATSLVGKWHLSGNGNISDQPAAYLPDNKGFDEITIFPGGMSSYQPGTMLYHKGGAFIKAPEYLTDYFGHLAVDFIHRKTREPFFLLLAFNAVHAPLHALNDDIAEFGDLEDYDPKRYLPHLKVEDRRPKMDRQVYSGMMRAMDRNIGRVLDALEAAGLTDNTLVLYINDNGGPSLTAPVHSYNQAANHPYRGNKFDCLEGGVRVPMAMRWPGHVPAGSSFSGLTSGLDILPTALTACGILPPEEKPLDGIDLLPFLNGSRAGNPHEALCWQAYFLDEVATGQAAIRSGKWKLHQYAPVSSGPQVNQWALYDLSTDPGEVDDLAAKSPEQVVKLDAAWRAWKEQMEPLFMASTKQNVVKKK